MLARSYGRRAPHTVRILKHYFDEFAPQKFQAFEILAKPLQEKKVLPTKRFLHHLVWGDPGSTNYALSYAPLPLPSLILGQL